MQPPIELQKITEHIEKHTKKKQFKDKYAPEAIYNS